MRKSCSVCWGKNILTIGYKTSSCLRFSPLRRRPIHLSNTNITPGRQSGYRQQHSPANKQPNPHYFLPSSSCRNGNRRYKNLRIRPYPLRWGRLLIHTGEISLLQKMHKPMMQRGGLKVDTWYNGCAAKNRNIFNPKRLGWTGH